MHEAAGFEVERVAPGSTEPLLTIREAALSLRVSEQTVWRRVRAGELRAVQLGGPGSTDPRTTPDVRESGNPMTRRRQQAPAAVVAVTEAREDVTAAEQRLRDVEREAREARQAVIDATESQHQAVYAAAKAGDRADVSEIRALVAARQQDAADMEVVVAAHADAVREARRALRDVILEHAPELLDLQEQLAAEAERARGEMAARHATERAEQDAREHEVRLEATTVLDEMPRVFANAMRGDELVPVIRPDRAAPDLAPYEVDASMPGYLRRAVEESRQLYRQETAPKMLAG
jgi:excisionase family DNA binding protein